MAGITEDSTHFFAKLLGYLSDLFEHRCHARLNFFRESPRKIVHATNLLGKAR